MTVVITKGDEKNNKDHTGVNEETKLKCKNIIARTVQSSFALLTVFFWMLELLHLHKLLSQTGAP